MSELEDLKRLLFGAEKQALDTLSDRVERPEMRAADIADVFPEALRLSHTKGDGSLVRELSEPVTHCLKESFQESPQQYADVLYPIMGPAIRKSIAYALRAFAQQINETMEHSFSAKGMRWRLQAMRSGVPFGEFVIQKTLQYRVEQAYLISRGNGLLIEHIHHDAARIKDSDAVSAMFTAIQDFVKESFSPDSNSRLETADMGEFTLWAVHGPHALLVSVIRGVPPASLRSDLSAILERIHFRYGDALRSYSGDTSTTQGVEVELAEAIQFQAKQQESGPGKKLWLPLVAALLMVTLVLGYFGYKRWQIQDQIGRLTATVDNEPGIYLGDIRYSDKTFMLSGLRDPLARDIEKIFEESDVDPSKVESNFRPYQSLDSEIVYRRALANIDPPEEVSVSLSEGVLILEGIASQQWIDALKVKAQTASIGMPVQMGDVQPIEMRDIEISLAELNSTEFYFLNSDNLLESELGRLDEFAGQLNILIERASAVGRQIEVRIRGYTDSDGSLEYNAALSKERASSVEQTLVGYGIPGRFVNIDDPSSFEFSGAERRSAIVLVSLSE